MRRTKSSRRWRTTPGRPPSCARPSERPGRKTSYRSSQRTILSEFARSIHRRGVDRPEGGPGADSFALNEALRQQPWVNESTCKSILERFLSRHRFDRSSCCKCQTWRTPSGCSREADMRRPLPRELWFGVLAFGVLAAGDHARTPGEDITPHDVKTEAEPGEGPLADPA